jgi:hypothetical protein
MDVCSSLCSFVQGCTFVQLWQQQQQQQAALAGSAPQICVALATMHMVQWAGRSCKTHWTCLLVLFAEE